jgi:hypothetical protein
MLSISRQIIRRLPTVAARTSTFAAPTGALRAAHRPARPATNLTLTLPTPPRPVAAKPIKTLTDLETAYYGYIDRLAPNSRASHPLNFARQDDGSYHVERRGDVFAVVSTERGSENSRFESRDPDAILYHLVESETSTLASREVSIHKGEDSRRQWFALAEAKLRALKPEWGDRYAAHVAEILSKHPYDDSLF